MNADIDALRAAAASLHTRLNPPGTFAVGVAIRLGGDRPGLDIFLTDDAPVLLPDLETWEGFPVAVHVLRNPALFDREPLR